jgi:hypothetical protein
MIITLILLLISHTKVSLKSYRYSLKNQKQCRKQNYSVLRKELDRSMGKSHSPSKIPKGPTIKSNNPKPTPVKSRENTLLESPKKAGTSPPSGIPKPPQRPRTRESSQESNSKNSVSVKSRSNIPTPRITSSSKGRVKSPAAIQVLKSVKDLTATKSREETFESALTPKIDHITDDEMNNNHDRYQKEPIPSYRLESSVPKSPRPSIPPDDRDAAYRKALESTDFFRTNTARPSFDKHFGPAGSTVLREVDRGAPSEDLSHLFPRPNTVPLKPQSYLESKAQPHLTHEAAPQRSARNPERPSTAPYSRGVNYTTQDLDDILAKYKPKVGKEYAVYSATVALDKETDPDFSRLPFERGNNNGSRSHAADDCKLNVLQDESKGVPEKDRLTSNVRNSKRIDTGKHSFPFKHSPEGELIVEPEQVRNS